MKTLFICDDFTYDLTGKELNWTEENSIFQDDFILSSTFPSELFFDEHPFFLQYQYFNGDNLPTKFDGILQRSNGEISPAVFEISEANERLKFTIRDGLELFPTWEKKLNELELGVVDVDNMLTHAATKISQTYPQTNYNFPMIYCNNLYKDNPLFAGNFMGFYNRRAGGSFQQNYENPLEGKYYNYNIVYPMPYWMHILKTGIQMGGYTLHGDVLEDETLKKMIHPPVIIQGLNDPLETEDIVVGYADMTEENSHWLNGWVKYEQHRTLEPIKMYRLRLKTVAMRVRLVVVLNGVVIFDGYNKHSGPLCDFTFMVTEESQLDFFSYKIKHIYDDVIEGQLIPIKSFDEDGNILGGLANFNKVDLAENLPDSTFGDFVKVIKAIGNYDFELRDGKEVWMNKVESGLTYEDAVDLQEFMVRIPNRKFEIKEACLLKYEFEHEEYKMKQTLVSLTETLTADKFEERSEVKTITINCVPWPVGYNEPVVEENPILTANIFSQENRISFVLYDGLKDGKNWTISLDEVETANLVEKNWKKFFYFIIRSIKFNWTTKGKVTDFFKVKKNSKVYAYGNYMLVESLNRKQKGQNEELEITARTF